jgi:predicted nucleic acid-binding Zn finger protein
LSEIFEDIKKDGLTDGLVSRLEKEYGGRGKKAIECYLSGKVKKYRDFFVVEGITGNYVVEGDFCDCNDFLFRLAQKGGTCYHSLAVKIAEATGKYEKIDEWYTDLISQKRPGIKK